MAYIYKLFKIDIGRVINYNQKIHQSYQKEGSMSSPRALYFKEAFVMEAANYALLAAAVSIILRIVVALVGGAV